MPKIGACGGLKKAERVPGTRLSRWLLFSVPVPSIVCRTHYSLKTRKKGMGMSAKVQ